MKNTPEQRLAEEQIQSLLAEYLVSKDTRIRDRIVLQYKSLVESIARRFTGSGEPMEDLAQEGYIGLITAVDLYDAGKGVKFSTYATHFIIGQIKHALRDRGKIIKEPAWLQELNHRILRVTESLYQEFGRQPTHAEIGRAMHMPEETIAEVFTTREIFKVTSLDCDQDENFGGVDLEKVTDDKCTPFQLPVEDKVVLETAMNKLKLVEQKVIQEFYFSGLNQTEIAKKLGISCNYVSHILRSGTRKLRRILTTEEIREVQTQLQLSSRRSNGPSADEAAGITDSLTGLYSMSYMESRLSEEINRASHDKYELAFAIVQIDGLEEYGIKHGTMHRDDIICALSRLVKGSVRRCDIVGRVSEYEFGLILLYTNGHADVVCERVSGAICDAEFDTSRTEADVKFLPHVGYASCPTDAGNARDLISRAQESLREAQSSASRRAA